jgi:hypothetical protein
MPFEQLIPRPFTTAGIEIYAPVQSGIYGISNASEWIYIGETDDIRDALTQHLRAKDTALMMHRPAGFVFEVCVPAQRTRRQHSLIVEYSPACNQRNRTDQYAYNHGKRTSRQ